MAVSLPQFIEFMQDWHASASPAARSHLPVSSWSQVYRMCEARGTGLVLDPSRVTGDLLDADPGLHQQVAVPLAQAIAAAFPATGAEAASPGAAGVDRPIGTLAHPEGRIGAALAVPSTATTSVPAAAYAPVPAPAVVPAPVVVPASPQTVSGAQAPMPSGAAEPALGVAAVPAASAVPSPASAVTATAVPSPPAQAGVPAVPAVPPPPQAPHSWVFPAYDYTRENLDRGDEGGDAVEVSVQVMEGGVLRYTWPDAGQNEVYRVVVSEEEPVYDPADGVDLAVTEELSCTDSTVYPYALHFVSVWGYERVPGTQELGQCRRVASVVHVHPLSGWSVEFDEGSRAVIGRWDQVNAPQGTRCTVVTAKLPVGESPHKYLHGSIWRSYATANNGAGFQDREVVGGRRHHYVAALEAEIDGTVYTSAIQHVSVLVTQRVEKVTDLVVEQVDNQGQGVTSLSLNLTWSEGKGSEVAIFLSRTAPNPAAVDRGRIPQAQLGAAGLREEDRITIPAGIEEIPDQPDRQRRSLIGVAWPDDVAWDSIYLTAVVLRDQEATLSQPVRTKRVAPPSEVVVTRHAASHDLVTFAWPGEAAEVQLYRDEQCQALAASVTQEKYGKDGGLIVESGMLDASGGVAYLTSLQHLAGQVKVSRPVRVQVPPLWVYRYDIRWPGVLKLRNHTASLVIEPLLPLADPAKAFTYCLVRNPRRLPLGPWDGELIPLMQQEPSKDLQPENYQALQMPPGQTSVVQWFDSSLCNGFYVRLMVSAYTAAAAQGQDLPVLEHYALLDPAIATLDRTSEGKGWFK